MNRYYGTLRDPVRSILGIYHIRLRAFSVNLMQ